VAQARNRRGWLVVTTILTGGGGQPVSHPALPPAAMPHGDGLQPGDLVFRASDSWAGRVVRTVDGDTPFTHVGIVVSTGEDPLVVHAAPGSAGEHGGVRAEPLSRYFSSVHARSGAVWRPVGIPSPVRQQAAQVAVGMATTGVRFDDGFDLATGDRVYCTELVWRAWQAVGLDLTAGRRDTVSLLGLRHVLILPSTLLKGGKLTRVAPQARTRALE